MKHLAEAERQARRRRQYRESKRRSRGSLATDEKLNEVEKWSPLLGRYWSTFAELKKEINEACAKFWERRGISNNAHFNSGNNKKRKNVLCETACGA